MYFWDHANDKGALATDDDQLDNLRKSLLNYLRIHEGVRAP